jgi:hypothetical protein
LRRGEAHAGFADASSLLGDLLALLSLQGREEFGEVGVRRRPVGPMKLHRAAQHPAGVGGCSAIGVVEEQHVCR